MARLRDRRVYNAAYRAAHPEAIAAYRAAHRKEHNAYARAYYAVHRDKKLASHRAWAAKNKNGRRAYQAANKERRWMLGLVYRYGLEPLEFHRFLERQRYSCARCGRPFGGDVPHVDHNHETGRVRGLLHGACNRKVHNRAEIDMTLAYLVGTNV